MSRDIGFRVWDAGKGEYAVGGGMNFVDTDKKGEYSSDVARMVRFVVEQDTGLKDRNGKKIYEGDIFENTINGGIWRVYWNEIDAAFWVDSGVAGCSLGEFDWDRSHRNYGFIRKNCEIIGNVHELNMEELCPSI